MERGQIPLKERLKPFAAPKKYSTTIGQRDISGFVAEAEEVVRELLENYEGKGRVAHRYFSRKAFDQSKGKT